MCWPPQMHIFFVLLEKNVVRCLQTRWEILGTEDPRARCTTVPRGILMNDFNKSSQGPLENIRVLSYNDSETDSKKFRVWGR